MAYSNVIGIDLSDTTLDVVLLSFSGDTHSITQKHSVAVPTGLIHNGVIGDLQAVVTFIKEQCQIANIPLDKKYPCAWVIPQCVTYTHVYTQTKKQTISHEAVVQSATKLAPISSQDIAISYLHPEDNLSIVVVSSRQIVEQWQKCAQETSNTKHLFFLEGYSALLGLEMAPEQGPYVIVDVGGRSTVVTFVIDGHVRGIFSSPLAGLYITEEIARARKCSFDEAQELKQTKGLATKSAVAPIIKAIVLLLSERIKGAIDFHEKKLAVSFQSAVYIGGSLKMKGLQSLIEKQIGLVEVDINTEKGKDVFCAFGAVRALVQEKEYAIFTDVYIKQPHFSFSFLNKKEKTSPTTPSVDTAISDTVVEVVDIDTQHIFAWRVAVIISGVAVLVTTVLVIWLFLQ